MTGPSSPGLTFSWHEEKAKRVLAERRIDFHDAVRIFQGDRIEVQSHRNGEERWITVGKIEGRLFAVVYTKREGVVWIITARRAWKSEERAFRDRYPEHGKAR